MSAADLIIVDVSTDHVSNSDDADFSESRLAGLIRQHSKAAQFIFTLQIASHQAEKSESYARRLRASLDTLITDQSYSLVHGTSPVDISKQVRELTYQNLMERLSQDKKALGKACSLFYNNIDVLLRSDAERHAANRRNA